MNKRKRFKQIIILLAFFMFTQFQGISQIYAPDGLRMPGDWNDWTNDHGMTGDFALQKIQTGTPRWQTIFQFTGTTGDQNFKFVSTSYGDPWGNQWTGNNSVSLNNFETFEFGDHGNNLISVIQNKWYTVTWEDSGYEDTRAIFMETSSEPVNIASVIQRPPLVQANETVNVEASLSSSPSPEEVFYLRYTTDNWTNSVLVNMGVTDNKISGTIPGLDDETEVDYYIFSSVSENITEDFDLKTIKINNNNGSNYSYIVGQEISCGEETSLITTDPAFPREDVPLIIYFNAEFGNGGLFNYENDVYAHTGVITDLSDSSTDWRYVVSEWGENTPETKLTRLGTNLYSLEIDDIREYYDVPDEEDILMLALVFRSEDETEDGYYLEHKTSSHTDILIDIYELELNVKILSPPKREPLVSPNQVLAVCVEALENNELSLYLDDELLITDNSSSVTYPLITQEMEPGGYWLVAKAISGENEVYDSTAIYLRGPVIEETLPANVVNGINYIDDNTVTIVLHDPPALKQFAFLIGDFSNWLPNDDNYMKWDSENNRFWVTITNLEPQLEYAFQYFIDDELKLPCAYADKNLDPWNDRWIPEDTYPDLKPYPFDMTTGIVSVFEINREEYQWEVTEFVPVAVDETQQDLIIYELLVRDFLDSRRILDVIDKLDYLSDLGVNAIELMPIIEFDGNESWGYAPNFFFSTDKYYGTRQAYKKFIDECHKRNIAVILDIVPNHAFGQNPMVNMYFDPEAGEWGQPAPENPWFNQQAPHPYSVGYDFNHENPYVRDFFKRVFEYWLTEFKVDGYRIDLSKGLTQTYSGDDMGTWSAYDQSRINILTDYYNHIKSVNPNAYVILEHFAQNDEETALANTGMLLWSAMHNNYKQIAMGHQEQSNIAWAHHAERGWNYPNLIDYMENHDEDRLMALALEYGNSSASYDLKDTITALRHMEMAAVLFLGIPGPKMIWQFGELGYDYSIFYGGDRLAPKPPRWDYYNMSERQKIHRVYRAMIDLRSSDAFRFGSFTHDLDGLGKRMWISHESMNVVVSANMGVEGFDMQPGFHNNGTWHNYFTGESIEVTDNSGHTIYFEPGDYYVFTNVPLDKPFHNLTVTVLSEDDELAIGGAQVDLESAGTRLSDTDGSCSFIVLTGSDVITVSKDGYDTYKNEIHVDEDMSIIIFLTESDMPDVFTVTFNVDMTDAVAEEDIEFDPEIYDVYITGTLTGWTEPGANNEFKLNPSENGIYTIDFILEPDEYLYKYFLVENTPTWEMGEWAGDPNREIIVDSNIVVNDVFGDINPDNDNTNYIDIHGRDKNIIIYPNPAGQFVNIVAPEKSKIYIFDVKSNLIYSSNISGTETIVDLSGLQYGVYFVKIIYEGNTIVRKIVKN